MSQRIPLAAARAVIGWVVGWFVASTALAGADVIFGWTVSAVLLALAIAVASVSIAVLTTSKLLESFGFETRSRDRLLLILGVSGAGIVATIGAEPMMKEFADLSFGGSGGRGYWGLVAVSGGCGAAIGGLLGLPLYRRASRPSVAQRALLTLAGFWSMAFVLGGFLTVIVGHIFGEFGKQGLLGTAEPTTALLIGWGAASGIAGLFTAIIGTLGVLLAVRSLPGESTGVEDLAHR